MLLRPAIVEPSLDGSERMGLGESTSSVRIKWEKIPRRLSGERDDWGDSK
jgi:hypothetical protein